MKFMFVYRYISPGKLICKVNALAESHLSSSLSKKKLPMYIFNMHCVVEFFY